MQTKVIIRENSWRLEKFQTKTILDTENGHQVIWKCPITETALPFISTIADREKASREYLKNHFDVLCGVLQDGCLKYDYLPYQSLLQIIEMQFQQDCPLMADKTIKSYVDKIKALQSIYTVPREFFKIIGLDDAYNNTKLLCLYRGLLDLTPRNILVNGEQWIVIDSEWSFDFPIPVAFVLFRAILEMALMLQSGIRRATTPSNPACCLFARGLNDYYIPTAWKTHLDGSQISLSEMFRWETGFRCYVIGSNLGTVGRIKRHQKIRSDFSRSELAYGVGFGEKLAYVLKAAPGADKAVRFFERRLRRLFE